MLSGISEDLTTTFAYRRAGTWIVDTQIPMQIDLSIHFKP